MWGGRGGEGSLQEPGVSSHWAELGGGSSVPDCILGAPSPVTAPAIAIPHSSPALISFHDPCSPFPFCPVGLQLLLEIIFFLISFLSLPSIQLVPL